MAQSRRLVEVQMPGAFSRQVRLLGLAARAALHKARVGFYSGRLYRWRYAAPVPERLLIAPPDLRTSDPTVADELIGGIFVFAGHVVNAADETPFRIEPPSPKWARELHEFCWLRHLRGSASPQARLAARNLVESWIALNGDWPQPAWAPEVVCARVLSWLAHSPLVLQDSEADFYHTFLKSLNRQVRYLRRITPDLPPGPLRLKAAACLVLAALSISGQKRFVRSSARRLDEELNTQILADGGHISRSPAAIIEILIDLLPLRQAFTACGLEPTKTITGAVERMMPMLRFFRHSDGVFAHFNGMGGTKSDLIATLLAYDEAQLKPAIQAKQSGYSRLEAGKSILVADTGRAPPLRFSQKAHAGCLSFEFSHNGQRIITNCGAPASHLTEWRHMTRATAAHSTLVMHDTSSCRFLPKGKMLHWLGPVIAAGPEEVRASYFESGRGLELVMSHDGYAASFGVVHERTLILDRKGESLLGIDTLSGRAIKGFDDYAIRFHIHPAIPAEQTVNGGRILLKLPNGERWEFEAAPGAEIALEDSVYMSETMGYRRSLQIVVYGNARQTNSLAWSFVKSGAPRARPLPDAHIKQAISPQKTAPGQAEHG